MDSVKETWKTQAMARLRRMTAFHWIMAGICLVAVILGLALHPAYLLLLVLPAFLGPLVREIGFMKDQDERVRFISYRSSHIAFYLTLAVIAAIFIARTITTGRGIEPEWFIVLIAPVAYKFFAALGLTYNTRILALAIGYAAGAIMAVIAAMSEHFFTQGLFIPLLVLLVTVVSHWLPKVGGGLLLLLGVGYLVMITKNWSPDEPLGLILSALLLGVPVLLAGLLLLFHQRMSGVASEDFVEEIPEETEF